MRKTIKAISAVALSAVMISGICAEAVEINTYSEDLKVYYEGEDVYINSINQPLIINDRTMVPLRPIFQAMGWEDEDIIYDDDSKTAVFQGGGSSCTFVNESVLAVREYEDGTETQFVLDVPAMIYDGSFYIPLRAFCELWEEDIEWDASSRSVYIGNFAENDDEFYDNDEESDIDDDYSDDDENGYDDDIYDDSNDDDIYADESVPNVTFSASIGEVDGVTYSVREVPGIETLPVNDHGQAIASFRYYDGYVYYILSEGGSSDYSTWLYRCKPDWTDEELLDEIICDPYNGIYAEGRRTFEIDNNILYYENYSDTTTAINLSDLSKSQANTPKHPVTVNGEEHESDWITGYYVYIFDDVCYFRDPQKNIYIYNEENEPEFLIDNAYLDGGVAGGYLYYAVEDNFIVGLYRYNLSDGTAEFIDSHMAAGGGVYFNW